VDARERAEEAMAVDAGRPVAMADSDAHAERSG
jgi:hypothetical protein